MWIKYKLFLSGLKIKWYVSAVFRFGIAQANKVLNALSDIFHESTATYISLRPSEILYTRDVISPICFESEGFKESVTDLIRDALWRRVSPKEIARNVTVIKRQDRRGPYYDKKNEDIHKLPGWWAVEGLGFVWVLKALEELNFVKLTKVRVIDSMSEEMWNLICSGEILDQGRSVSFVSSGKESLETEKLKIYKEWRKYLGPHWTRVETLFEKEGPIRMVSYEIGAKRAQNTHSCSGYGLCHSTKLDDTDEPGLWHSDHKCHRPFATILRQPSYRYTRILDELLDWRLWIKFFIFLSFLVTLSVCYIR
ncbi:uncharacterized protein LOC143471353 [Clavelina lepadiformis]|uniref:Uncharacterized protein n=1 Tax=Clavelina lepadiformis TaxID=159417 RepID=A0ABP0GH79_CLALP